MVNKVNIKAATRRIVHFDERTMQITADFLGVAKSEVSYWSSDHHERFIPVDHLIELDAVSGDSFLKQWAKSRGYDLIKHNVANIDTPSLLHVASSLSREAGDAVAEVIEAQSDNVITASERRRILDKFAPVKDRIAQIEHAIGG